LTGGAAGRKKRKWKKALADSSLREEQNEEGAYAPALLVTRKKESGL